MVVGTEHDRAVNRVELGAADLSFIRLWMIKRLLDIVRKLAKFALLTLLLQPAVLD